MTDNAHYIRRTFEPLKFLGRLMFIPLRIEPGTPLVTLTSTHEAEEPFRYAPTVVVKAGPLPFGLGIGWWRDSGLQEAAERQEAGEDDIEYSRYVAVNGVVDKDDFQQARREVARMGLDPDEEMEYLQSQGLFE